MNSRAMSTWVLLLRGVNVGGAGKLPMGELVGMLESLGLENVRTYIQSGNVVFESKRQISAELAEEIAAVIHDRKGFRPTVLILNPRQLHDAAASNPFEGAEEHPKSVHLFFLSSAPSDPDIDALTELSSSTERFHLTDEVFYLYAPDGVGRSKLAKRAERILGVPVTARNWRTVTKLLDMVESSER